MACKGTGLAEDVRCGDGEVDGQLGGQIAVGQTSDTIGAEETCHVGSGVGARQRLLYCGALRAFFRPALRRSLARGSRVR